MRKLFSVLLILVLTLTIAAPVAMADKPVAVDSNGNETAWASNNAGCTTIQSGLLTDSAGNKLVVGFDQFGYNYQAHQFVGTYDSSDRNLDGTYWGQTGDYVDDKLMMKWSDAWIANVDCTGDGKLDRGLVDGTINNVSMGWLTNHVVGDSYTDFVKIVWVGSGGLWGAYDIIQEVYNDPTGNYHFKLGVPGLGLNDGWTTTTP